MNLIERTRMALSAFKGPAGAIKEPESNVSSPSSSFLSLIQGKGSPKRGTRELMQAYKEIPRLRAILSRISSDVAAIPWKLYAVKGKGGKGYVRRRDFQGAPLVLRQKLAKDLQVSGELEEITDHPLLDLLAFGNPILDGASCQRIGQVYYDLKGEQFFKIERATSGLPLALWPAPPHWVRQIGTQERPYQVQVGATTETVPSADMLYLRDPDPENPYGRGTGIGESLADELDTEEFAAEYIRNFFGNSAVPPFLLSFKTGNKETVERFRTIWDQFHRGVGKAHRPEFLTGEINLHEFNQSMEQLQMIPLREFTRDILVETFGIPPEIIGIGQDSNKAKITAARLIYAENVLIPRKETQRAFLQERLVPEYDDRIVLDFVSPAPDDEEMRLQIMTAAPWQFTRNDWRRAAGFPDDPQGDVYLTPMNLIEVPQAGKRYDGGAKQAARRKVFRAEDVGAVTGSIDPEDMEAALKPVLSSEIETTGQHTLSALGLDNLPEFNPNHSRISEYLRNRGSTQITNITDTTRQAIRDTLTEGIGEGVDDLARRIRSVFADASVRRSETIARTEANAAANFGITEGYRQSGVVTRRQWVTTRDGNQRESHDDLDGQERGLQDEFTLVSGENVGAGAQYPGDFGIAEEDINCRCTTTAVIDDPIEEEARLDAIWRSYDAEVRPWERKLKSAAKDAFDIQEEQALSALARYE